MTSGISLHYTNFFDWQLLHVQLIEQRRLNILLLALTTLCILDAADSSKKFTKQNTETYDKFQNALSKNQQIFSHICTVNLVTTDSIKGPKIIVYN